MMTSSSEVYQVKVTLLHTPEGWPSVWRRLHVPADMRLDRFHRALQISMGWHDAHLHEFHISGRRFGRPDLEEDFGQDPPENERRFQLDQLLSDAGEKATYIYDYGDNWEHEILLEQVMPSEPGRQYPICTDGYYQCPPEDCGGVAEYERLLRM